MCASRSRQDYKQTGVYDKLLDEHDIFPNNIDVFVFLAAIGYGENRFDPDDFRGDGEMLWMHFSDRELYRAAAAAIAYQHTNDPTALLDPDIQLEVMAQYAKGGSDYIEELAGDMKETPREALLEHIRSFSSPKQRERTADVLQDIADSFDKSMFPD